MGIVLTDENYYSEQANRDYMSVSQFKEFAGTLMHTTCEETAYKNAQGMLPQIMTKPLLVGSYIDAFYEGTLNNFKRCIIAAKSVNHNFHFISPQNKIVRGLPTPRIFLFYP